MTYRVEYDGGDVEIPTLNAAIEGAKQAIAADAGPIGEWAVEYDETINDWFVRGYVDGEPVGLTAVVSGPEPTPDPAPEPVAATPPLPTDGAWHVMAFDGVNPAEAFGRATAWLAGRVDLVDVGDVGWQRGGPGVPYQVRIHFRAPRGF
jgi:hypothetical protein